MTDGLVAKRIVASLRAYCIINKIKLIKSHEQLNKDTEMEDELIEIAKNDIHIEGFNGFRMLKFYKNPDINKEIIERSILIIICFDGFCIYSDQYVSFRSFSGLFTQTLYNALCVKSITLCCNLAQIGI